ncbi:MAG: helix-turn-helix domain-containing protein, partial [Bacilli bacterium]
MTLGEKIRHHRTLANFTQKEFADKVNVTAQAVSRWEQDIVEPSIQTLKRMSEIFNVSLDEFLSNSFVPKQDESPPSPTPVIIQQITQERVNEKRTIGVCEHCNRPILEGEKIHRHRFGLRNNHQLVLCEACNQNRIISIQNDQWKKTKKNRFWAYFWGVLFSSPFIYGSFQGFFSGNLTFESFLTGLGLSYILFSFFFTYTMKNNFIHSFFWEITSWGFVRLPGIIFSFDIDGLIFLITAKIILFFIGIGIALVAGSFALILSLLLSGFVLPFALFNAYTNPE